MVARVSVLPWEGICAFLGLKDALAVAVAISPTCADVAVSSCHDTIDAEFWHLLTEVSVTTPVYSLFRKACANAPKPYAIANGTSDQTAGCLHSVSTSIKHLAANEAAKTAALSALVYPLFTQDRQIDSSTSLHATLTRLSLAEVVDCGLLCRMACSAADETGAAFAIVALALHRLSSDLKVYPSFSSSAAKIKPVVFRGSSNHPVKVHHDPGATSTSTRKQLGAPSGGNSVMAVAHTSSTQTLQWRRHRDISRWTWQSASSPSMLLTPSILFLALDILLPGCAPEATKRMRELGVPLVAFAAPALASCLVGSVPWPQPSATARWMLMLLATDGWLAWLRLTAATLSAVQHDIAECTTGAELLGYLATFPRRGAIALSRLVEAYKHGSLSRQTTASALLLAACRLPNDGSSNKGAAAVSAAQLYAEATCSAALNSKTAKEEAASLVKTLRSEYGISCAGLVEGVEPQHTECVRPVLLPIAQREQSQQVQGAGPRTYGPALRRIPVLTPFPSAPSLPEARLELGLAVLCRAPAAMLQMQAQEKAAGKESSSTAGLRYRGRDTNSRSRAMSVSSQSSIIAQVVGLASSRSSTPLAHTHGGSTSGRPSSKSPLPLAPVTSLNSTAGMAELMKSRALHGRPPLSRPSAGVATGAPGVASGGATHSAAEGVDRSASAHTDDDGDLDDSYSEAGGGPRSASAAMGLGVTEDVAGTGTGSAASASGAHVGKGAGGPDALAGAASGIGHVKSYSVMVDGEMDERATGFTIRESAISAVGSAQGGGLLPGPRPGPGPAHFPVPGQAGTALLSQGIQDKAARPTPLSAASPPPSVGALPVPVMAPGASHTLLGAAAGSATLRPGLAHGAVPLLKRSGSGGIQPLPPLPSVSSAGESSETHQEGEGGTPLAYPTYISDVSQQQQQGIAVHSGLRAGQTSAAGSPARSRASTTTSAAVHRLASGPSQAAGGQQEEEGQEEDEAADEVIADSLRVLGMGSSSLSFKPATIARAAVTAASASPYPTQAPRAGSPAWEPPDAGADAAEKRWAVQAEIEYIRSAAFNSPAKGALAAAASGVVSGPGTPGAALSGDMNAGRIRHAVLGMTPEEQDSSGRHGRSPGSAAPTASSLLRSARGQLLGAEAPGQPGSAVEGHPMASPAASPSPAGSPGTGLYPAGYGNSPKDRIQALTRAFKAEVDELSRAASPQGMVPAMQPSPAQAALPVHLGSAFGMPPQSAAAEAAAALPAPTRTPPRIPFVARARSSTVLPSSTPHLSHVDDVLRGVYSAALAAGEVGLEHLQDAPPRPPSRAVVGGQQPSKSTSRPAAASSHQGSTSLAKAGQLIDAMQSGRRSHEHAAVEAVEGGGGGAGRSRDAGALFDSAIATVYPDALASYEQEGEGYSSGAVGHYSARGAAMAYGSPELGLRASGPGRNAMLAASSSPPSSRRDPSTALPSGRTAGHVDTGPAYLTSAFSMSALHDALNGTTSASLGSSHGTVMGVGVQLENSLTQALVGAVHSREGKDGASFMHPFASESAAASLPVPSFSTPTQAHTQGAGRGSEGKSEASPPAHSTEVAAMVQASSDYAATRLLQTAMEQLAQRAENESQMGQQQVPPMPGAGTGSDTWNIHDGTSAATGALAHLLSPHKAARSTAVVHTAAASRAAAEPPAVEDSSLFHTVHVARGGGQGGYGGEAHTPVQGVGMGTGRPRLLSEIVGSPSGQSLASRSSSGFGGSLGYSSPALTGPPAAGGRAVEVHVRGLMGASSARQQTKAPSDPRAILQELEEVPPAPSPSAGSSGATRPSPSPAGSFLPTAVPSSFVVSQRQHISPGKLPFGVPDWKAIKAKVWA